MIRIKVLCVALGIATAYGAAAQTDARHGGTAVSGAVMERDGKLLSVRMTVETGKLGVPSNRATLITPIIVKGKDSLALPSVGIYGSRRYYFYMREGGSMLSGKGETSYRSADAPDTVAYGTVVDFERWMNGSHLYVRRRDYGCCHTLLAENGTTEIKRFPVHPDYWEELPPFAFIRPKTETIKTREIVGSAFIDFPVNKTVIRPGYRNNAAELAKITATIDSVRGDADYSVTSLSIKGFASPEGPYAANARLAAGRTQALKEHVSRLYDFEPDFITTSHEAEDWHGLRKYVEKTTLPNKAAIIDIIDSDIPHDAKENRIKTEFPDDYRFLLDHCYPALRHSDYRIEYTVKRFSDVEEIKRTLKSQPGKLSLEELYIAAQTMETGSDEFNEVFEIAARLYPDDATANLNAAYTAINRRDMKRAAACLAKAGHSPEAVYARGVYALLTDNEAEARPLLEKAGKMGVTEAATALKLMEENNL